MFIIVSALCLTLAAGAPNQARVSGGSETTITQYPSMAAVLHSRDLLHYTQACGGIIISYSSVLTAAHCVFGFRPVNFRFRVGSTYANSGGSVHEVYSMIWHHDYNMFTHDHDIVMIRTIKDIILSNSVQYANLPEENFLVPDNEIVWATGWGSIYFVAIPIEELHQSQMLTLNLKTCKTTYEPYGRVITDSMICTDGLAGPTLTDTCLGDAGGPLYYNGTVVGVASSPSDCGNSQLPAVYSVISRYLEFIEWNSA